MASIRRRGHSWQARVHRKGFKTQVSTFPSKTEALRWAREQEHLLDGQRGARTLPADGVTFGQLLRRYVEAVTPAKRGAEVERLRARCILQHDICKRNVAALHAGDVALYRDLRLGKVCPDTVRRELTLLRHVWAVAKREWSLSLGENPFAGVRLPPPAPGRQRRLSADEWRRLQEAARAARTPWLLPMMIVAHETALRRSELLALRPEDVDLDRQYLIVRQSKSGHSRVVPFTPAVQEALSTWRVAAKGGVEALFPVTANALKLAFRRACARAGVTDFRWHDFRHCATSRFAEMGFSPPELMALTGHRQLHSLMRYTHVYAAHLQEKLRAACRH